MLAANILLIFILLALPWIYYYTLPEIVPTHWGLQGEVTSTGSKYDAVLILSVTMPIANIIILIIWTFRWVLVRKYPYLINLPAITMVLGSEKFPQEKKDEIIEKIFDISLLIGIIVGVYMLILEWGILESMRTGTNPVWLTIFSIVGIVFLIIPPFLLYRKIYREEILPYTQPQ